MKFGFLYIAFLLALALEKSVHSQVISASYSLIAGSPRTGSVTFPNFPARYGISSAFTSAGGRVDHKIIVHNSLIYSFLGSQYPSNDVWTFNSTDRKWTWIAGSSVLDEPSFGPLGFGSVLYTPGRRINFVGDIHRTRLEYILFGGYIGNGQCRGDLWTFDLSTYSWTWLAGSSSDFYQTPVYNIIGISTQFTTPGVRDAVGCAVYHETGEFLLYGYGLQRRSDMWAFNFTNLRWTWISGSSLIDVGPSAGPKGVWSASYFPGGRAADTDLALNPDTNILYIFGGYSTEGVLNDLWAFKRSSNQWALISGSTTVKSPGVCGTKGFSDQNNTPGARYGHVLVYHHHSRLLILFGGEGYSCTNSYGSLPDTWAYNPATNEWAWLAGNSLVNYDAGNYDALGSQYGGSMAVDRDTPAIYMFGGYGYSTYTGQSIVDYVWSANITAPTSSTASMSRSTITGSFSSIFSISSRASSVASATSPRFTSLPSSAASTFGVQFTLPKSSLSYLVPVTIVISDLSNTTVTSNPGESEISVAATSSSENSPSIEVAIGDNGMASFYKSVSKQRTETKKSTGIYALDSSTIFSRLWSVRFRILAALLVTLLVVTSCVAFRLTRGRKERHSTVTTSDFQPGISTISDTSGHTTVAGSTIGVYIPGGLQVDGAVAYRTKRELARGGGGSVWLATAIDSSLKEYGETVIVKIPNAKEMNGRAVALFHQEIALMNAFKHNRHMAQLLGFSENPYSTILKFYPKGSLSTWISSGARTLRQSVSFVKDISHGISLLHYNGIVHCDLKPDNVLIDFGYPLLIAVITDFGISRIVTEQLLKVGAYKVQLIKGASLAYAAPEVIRELRGANTAQRSTIETMSRDVYAIGMILGAILNGKNAWK